MAPVIMYVSSAHLCQRRAASVNRKRQIVVAVQNAECRMSCTGTVILGLMRAPIAESGADVDTGAVQCTVLLGYNDPVISGPLSEGIQ